MFAEKTLAQARQGVERWLQDVTKAEGGQHTEEILLELGYTWEDIGRFKEQAVIA